MNESKGSRDLLTTGAPLRRPVCSRAGFTFLEVLVALAILGSAFLVLLTAHSAALRQEDRARRLMTAGLLARQVLTDTEVNGFPELGGDDGDFGEEFAEYTWERTVLTPNLPIPVSSVDVREVHIQVSWPDRGAATTLDLVYFAVKVL